MSPYPYGSAKACGSRLRFLAQVVLRNALLDGDRSAPEQPVCHNVRVCIAGDRCHVRVHLHDDNRLGFDGVGRDGDHMSNADARQRHGCIDGEIRDLVEARVEFVALGLVTSFQVLAFIPHARRVPGIERARSCRVRCAVSDELKIARTRS